MNNLANLYGRNVVSKKKNNCVILKIKSCCEVFIQIFQKGEKLTISLVLPIHFYTLFNKN